VSEIVFQFLVAFHAFSRSQCGSGERGDPPGSFLLDIKYALYWKASEVHWAPNLKSNGELNRNGVYLLIKRRLKKGTSSRYCIGFSRSLSVCVEYFLKKHMGVSKSSGYSGAARKKSYR